MAAVDEASASMDRQTFGRTGLLRLLRRRAFGLRHLRCALRTNLCRLRLRVGRLCRRSPLRLCGRRGSQRARLVDATKRVAFKMSCEPIRRFVEFDALVCI